MIGATSAVLAAAGVGCGQTLCVALSGGADSSVLLHVLAALREPFGFALVAAHVHHGLSPNADAWERFCERRCEALAVPFHAFRVAVARGDPAGLEAAARAARHAALAKVPCDWRVTGHHLDDQAETLLFRLLRGTGVRGAGAMGAIETGRPGRLRPLLGLRRAEILAYARAAGLEWIEDESNADLRYSRNLLRHRVLPVLEAAAPGAVPALGRAAEHFREADKLLADLAELDASACGGERMRCDALLALADERVRNLLRWRIHSLGMRAPDRARLVEAVRQLRAAGGANPLRLELGEAACCVYRGVIWVEPAAAALQPRPVIWRGDESLAWGGGTVRFEPAQGRGLSRARLARASAIELAPRWAGLAMRVAPNRPRRSFKNLCQEAGIPAWMRARLPVLRVDGAPAWIGGIGLAPELACAPDEEGVLPVWAA